jgi:hypothetical protein
MVAGIIALSLVVGRLGPITAWACAAAVGLGIVSYVVPIVRQRPRVVMTPPGFTVYKFVGSESHKWEDIDGQFVVTKLGWQFFWRKVVGYRLKAEFDTRQVVGDFRSCPEELAALLNEHKQRNLIPPTGGPKVEAPPEKP